MKRFSVTPHRSKPDWWTCRDTQYNIVIDWENGKFNETQKSAISLNTLRSPVDSIVLATAMREMADYLREHHYDLVFPDPGRKILGDKITELRTKRGIPIRTLAEMCNLSPRTIQNIQNGDFSPRYDIVEKILRALRAHIEIRED